MNKVIDLSKVAAVPGMEGQADERYPILGNLIWYSLRDVRITQEQMRELFIEHGLSLTHLPPEIREVDAYRRATSDINEMKPKTLQDGTFEILMCREVANTDDEVVRHLVREIRDSKNKRLDYKQVGTLIFRKEEKDFIARPLEAEYEGVIADTEARYKEYLQFYTGKHIRMLVGGLVEGTNSVNLRSVGGVYFVSKEHNALVESLEGFVKATNNYAAPSEIPFEAIFESVPMLDLEKQRALIFDKYEQQCAGIVDKTLVELVELLKANKAPSKSVKANYVNSLKTLKAGIMKYEGLLERDLDIARLKYDVLNKQVEALLNKEDGAKPSPAPATQGAQV